MQSMLQGLSKFSGNQTPSIESWWEEVHLKLLFIKDWESYSASELSPYLSTTVLADLETERDEVLTMQNVGTLLLRQYSANKSSIETAAWSELASYKWKEEHFTTNIVEIERLMRINDPFMEDEIKRRCW